MDHRRDLECMLCDEMAEPKALQFSLLHAITDFFSDKLQIGQGGFATVYKGILENRVVAVKRMTDAFMDEKVFEREVKCLMKVKHKNIVRFLGYCADRQGSMQLYDGKFVMADVHQRLLCFEYHPKGSLEKHITDISCKLQWKFCYQIITGICRGLHYLHEKQIAHLDLKPANILLDDSLVPKITDFGISRSFDEMQSRVITKIAGTVGYMAPESFNTTKPTYLQLYRLDIFSLGVVITEILTGERGYHNVDNVVERWSDIVETSQRDIQLKQVRVCAQIAIKCIESNPENRPDTEHIINRLNEYIETSVITSQQAEDALNELRQGRPNVPGETSSKQNTTAVTVAGTSTSNTFWENTTKLDKVYETIHSLNPDIKQCLEFCSIFPKGTKLRRDELVHMWIALGFINTSNAAYNHNVETIAWMYIKELVSCLFLQPIRTIADTDCFTIHDVLYDILDKVAVNFSRVENASSHGLIEGFPGHRIKPYFYLKHDQASKDGGLGSVEDVPRHIQHLFIQNYDGELISHLMVRLEYLLTLVIYVGKDTQVEEKVVESICNRYPKLRVLAIAFSQEQDPTKQSEELSVPGSVGQLDLKECAGLNANHLLVICRLLLLKYLRLGGGIRYVPSIICRLECLETLDMRTTGVVTVCTEVLMLPKLRHLIGKFQLASNDLADENPGMLKKVSKKLFGLNRDIFPNKLIEFLREKSVLEMLAGIFVGNGKGLPQLLRHMPRLREVKIWCDSTTNESTDLTELEKGIKNFTSRGLDMPIHDNSLSIDFRGSSQSFRYCLEMAGYLTSLKLSGDLTRHLMYSTRFMISLEELCLSWTNLSGAEICLVLSTLSFPLRVLTLVENKLEGLTIDNSTAPFVNLERIYLVGVRSLDTIIIQDLRCLLSVHLLCKNIGELPGIQIGSLRDLEEVGLHSGVDADIKRRWEDAAMSHDRKPKVVSIEVETH